MPPQFGDAFINAGYIDQQAFNFFLNKPGLLAHFYITHNGAHRVEGQRHGVG